MTEELRARLDRLNAGEPRYQPWRWDGVDQLDPRLLEAGGWIDERGPVSSSQRAKAPSRVIGLIR